MPGSVRGARACLVPFRQLLLPMQPRLVSMMHISSCTQQCRHGGLSPSAGKDHVFNQSSYSLSETVAERCRLCSVQKALHRGRHLARVTSTHTDPAPLSTSPRNPPGHSRKIHLSRPRHSAHTIQSNAYCTCTPGYENGQRPHGRDAYT